MAQYKSRIPDILRKYEQEILVDWLQEQSSIARQLHLVKEETLKQECQELLTLLVEAMQGGTVVDLSSPNWAPVKEFLSRISKSRGLQGLSPAETAVFVLSLKKPLFSRLRKEVKGVEALGEEVWIATEALDRMALLTTEEHQKTREELISRQQHEMMELSTPVVKLWDGVLALPLIGTLDSARTQVVMEALLEKIVATGSNVAIIDITGVPTVDTLVAQHLLKTVTAARLMGAECIISGIRPQIAQTIVHLGVTLSNVSTKASLADAFQLALQRTGFRLVKGESAPVERL